MTRILRNVGNALKSANKFLPWIRKGRSETVARGELANTNGMKCFRVELRRRRG